MSVINRGWGLTTLNMNPNKYSDLEGGVEGLKEYEFEMKWTKYVKKYKVRVNYDCDSKPWIALPWKVKQVHDIFLGGKEYVMEVPNRREGEWGKLCPTA
jgi:hypothetical protein